MKKLESLNNEKFAALQSSEIGNLAAVVGGEVCNTRQGTDVEWDTPGGSCDETDCCADRCA